MSDTPKNKSPLYDLSFDHEIDTLTRHAHELEPGKSYHFRLPAGNWTGHLDNLRACLPKDVILTCEPDPDSFWTICRFTRALPATAPATDGIESAQTEKSLRKLLPGLRAPLWLRRVVRNWKAAREAEEAARKARIDARINKAREHLEKALSSLDSLQGFVWLRGLGLCYSIPPDGSLVSAYGYVVRHSREWVRVTATEHGSILIESV